MSYSDADKASFWMGYLQAVTKSPAADQEGALKYHTLAAPTTIAADFDNKDVSKTLAQVYTIGNTVPDWSLTWSGTTGNDLFGNYQEFVNEIVPKTIDEDAEKQAQAVKKQIEGLQSDISGLRKQQYSQWLQDNCLQIAPDGITCTQLVPGAQSWSDYWASYQQSGEYSAKVQVLEENYGDTLDGLQDRLLHLNLQAYGPNYREIAEANTAADHADPNSVSVLTTEQRQTYQMQINQNGVMTWVPRFVTGDLDQYKSWLTTTQSAFNSAETPAVQFAFSDKVDTQSETHWQFKVDVGVPIEEFFWLGEKGGASRQTHDVSKYSFTGTIAYQDTYFLSLSPDSSWFFEDMLSKYSTFAGWPDGSPFQNKELWGPNGMQNGLNILVKGVIVGVGGYLSMEIDQSSHHDMTYAWESHTTFGIGPFNFESADASGGGSYSKDTFLSNGLQIKDPTPTPKILGLVVSTPNDKS